MRADISFKTTDGLTLKGWLFTPQNGADSHPAIVMAHGFTTLSGRWGQTETGQKQSLSSGIYC
jgi:cephalosporin-C deacetylase-like acetyl esterase